MIGSQLYFDFITETSQLSPSVLGSCLVYKRKAKHELGRCVGLEYCCVAVRVVSSLAGNKFADGGVYILVG